MLLCVLHSFIESGEQKSNLNSFPSNLLGRKLKPEAEIISFNFLLNLYNVHLNKMPGKKGKKIQNRAKKEKLLSLNSFFRISLFIAFDIALSTPAEIMLGKKRSHGTMCIFV